MGNENNVNNTSSKKPRVKRAWLRKYNRLIVKNVPFYFFTGALAIVYIANGHYADKMMRKISKSENSLKEMRYEFKSVKRDVIFRSKSSELAKAVEPLGLVELIDPPIIIKDTLKQK